jgi:hypothetical protein
VNPSGSGTTNESRDARPNVYAHAEVPQRLDSLASAGNADGEDGDGDGLPLVRFLDGMHSFDEICMEVGKSEKWVEERMRRGWGADVQFVWR